MVDGVHISKKVGRIFKVHTTLTSTTIFNTPEYFEQPYTFSVRQDRKKAKAEKRNARRKSVWVTDENDVHKGTKAEND